MGTSTPIGQSKASRRPIHVNEASQLHAAKRSGSSMERLKRTSIHTTSPHLYQTNKRFRPSETKVRATLVTFEGHMFRRRLGAFRAYQPEARWHRGLSGSFRADLRTTNSRSDGDCRSRQPKIEHSVESWWRCICPPVKLRPNWG